MKITRLLYLLFLVLPFQLVAQEMIYPATVATEKAAAKKRVAKYMAKDDALIELPFVDDFSADYFPGNEEGNPVLWEDNYATLSRGLPLNPPTVGAVSFDGTDELGFPYEYNTDSSQPTDTLTSCPINLDYNPDDGIGLSFYFQPKGNSFFLPLASTDSLILEFFAPELDQWFWIWSTVDISSPESFTFVYLPITNARYLKEGFKFRFRCITNPSGLISVWNVDYVRLDQNNLNTTPIENDVAFVNGPVSFLQDYSAMPLSHYAENPLDRMLTNIQVLFRNLNDEPRTLEGNEIVISHEGTTVDILQNFNEPPIGAQSTASYTHPLVDEGNQYSYDTNLADDELIFDVSIDLGTSDYVQTVSNNSFKFKQSFYTHYSYDDGSAEAALAVPGNGSQMAIQYNNYKSDSIWALRMYSMPQGIDYENSTMNIKVWQDDGGIPGAELASTQHEFVHGRDDYQQEIVYVFEEPVFIPSGTFFVGFNQVFQQTQPSSGLRIGLDFNTAGNDGRLFLNEGQGWYPTFIGLQKSIMIQPMFTTEGYQDIVASTRQETAIPGLRIYPNPARQLVHLKSESQSILSVSIFDISGRLIDQDRVSNTLDVSGLAPGIYLLQVSDPQGRYSVKKLSIER
ncbi:MAG: T9SS type A sorting domain-containing protein [Cryomorphaceae bacterium]